MKKHTKESGFAPLIPIIVIALLAGGGGTVVASQNALPGDALYGIKSITENTRVAFAFTDESKAEVYLAIAEEKVGEIEKLEEEGADDERKQEALKRADENRARAMERAKKAKENGKSVDELVELITENMNRQQAVLQGVLAGAPEQAKPALQRSLEESRKGFEQSIEAVRQAVPEIENETGDRDERANEDAERGREAAENADNNPSTERPVPPETPQGGR